MKQFFKNSWVKLVLIFSVVDWKDVLVRSLKTSWQAAFGVFCTVVPTLFTLSGNLLTSALGGLASSMLSTAACAAWNGVISPALKALNQKADEVLVAETEPISNTDGGMVQVQVSAVDGATGDEVTAALKQAEQDALEEIKKG